MGKEQDPNFPSSRMCVKGFAYSSCIMCRQLRAPLKPRQQQNEKAAKSPPHTTPRVLSCPVSA